AASAEATTSVAVGNELVVGGSDEALRSRREEGAGTRRIHLDIARGVRGSEGHEIGARQRDRQAPGIVFGVVGRRPMLHLELFSLNTTPAPAPPVAPPATPRRSSSDSSPSCGFPGGLLLAFAAGFWGFLGAFFEVMRMSSLV